MKRDQPEFMDELISIAAIGRTLGVHLILATQKPAGVVDDKIWSNSRFRICLRVQSEGDSRDMIKIPNAAWITKPGRGYFQVGSDEVFEEMQFAWSGAPYNQQEDSTTVLPVMEVRLNGKREPLLTGERRAVLKGEDVPKQLQVFIDYVAQSAADAGIRRLPGPWLPPLPETLEWEGLQDWQEEENRDLLLDGGASGLKPLVGLLDDLLISANNHLHCLWIKAIWSFTACRDWEKQHLCRPCLCLWPVPTELSRGTVTLSIWGA